MVFRRLTGARVYFIHRVVEGRLEGKNPRVAYLRLIDVEEADGELRVEYDAAIGRAGKVFQIVKAMSLRPRALRAAMDLYREVMFGRSELSRADRELLAVVVSCANDCHY
jgi:alkylhydroperoxidase family enzyme